MGWLLACGIVVLVSGAAALPQDWKVGQSVKTTSGIVTGQAGKAKPNVSEYLGIPYAKPPVGDLRWAAPVAFKSDNSINASTYSLDCAATFQSPELAIGLGDDFNPSGVVMLTELMQLGHKVTEDCLTVNVWTKPQSGEKAKAVLLWIYGGGFATGNTANSVYDGQFLANDEDVVVVSFNYRENIFGFPGIDDPSVAKNAGLLDQRLAAEWVRDNIAAFGGDPKRITIFGESAGGASVDYYTYAWTEDPIIAGAIAQSGSVMSFANPIPKNNLKWWRDAANTVKCPSEPIAESVKCMRGKSMDDLLQAQKVDNAIEAVLGHFGPSEDGKVVFGDYVARGKAGKVIKKPYMTGNNQFEAGLFVLIARSAGIKISPKVWPPFNAAVFTCPAASAAEVRSANKIPVWRYRYFGDWPNTDLDGRAGAYHTAEIPMIFGTSAFATTAPDSPAEDKVSKFMQKVWTQFAKDPTALTKAPFNLPNYVSEEAYSAEQLIGFGANNLTRHLLKAGDYDDFCISIETLMATIPGGLQASINNVANGRDMGIPGMPVDQIPDMTPPPLPPAPKGAS